MGEPNNILDYELDMKALTSLQRELHGILPKDPTKRDNDQKDVALESIFLSEPIRTGRSPHIPVKLRCVPEDGHLVYEADTRMHFLKFTYMYQMLPDVKVLPAYKGKVQICWPRNVGLNIVTKGTLTTDKSSAQNFDDIWMNIHYQNYLPEKWDRSHVDTMIGNLPFLTEWTDHLPPFPLYIMQVWDYCRHDIKAFQVYRCGGTKILHKYDVRSALSSLIRFRVRIDEDSEWVESKYTEKMSKYLSGPSKLPTPELWGYYSKIVTEELNAFPTEDVIYTHDVVSLDQENLCSLGQTVVVDLDCDAPCLSINVVVENTKATSNNNLSNFTTNSEDILQGWGPVVSTKLNYGGMNRIPEMESGHADRINPLMFGRSPSQPGYYMIPIAQDPMTLGTDTTVVFKDTKGKLTLKLGDTDPFSGHNQSTSGEDIDEISSIIKSNDKGEDADKIYRIRVRLLVVRKLQFHGGLCTVVQAISSK